MLSQARSDPLSTPHWAPLSPLGSSVCCRVRQAMGLCASLVVADFRPICGEKICLVYHPSFIVHILFVNPTNYIFSCYRPSFFSCSLSFAPTHAHKTAKKKRKKKPAAVRIKYSSKHWQSQWAIKCRPQPVHKQRDCSSVKQWLWSSWRKITWYKKNKTKQKKKPGDNHAVTTYHKTIFCSTFSCSHTQIAHHFRKNEHKVEEI